MYKRKRVFHKQVLKYGAAVLLLLTVVGQLRAFEGGEASVFWKQMQTKGQENALNTIAPLFVFVQGTGVQTGQENYFYGLLEKKMPLAAYVKRNGYELSPESRAEYEMLLRLEGTDEESGGDVLNLDETTKDGFYLENEQAAKQADTGQESGGQAQHKDDTAAWSGAPAKKQMIYPIEEYREYDKLVKEFYAIDPTTMADETLLQVDALLEKDMTLQESGDGPQILIYHTHSQEGFIDSVPGEESMTVVGAGDYLAKLLEERYGLRVLHHKGQYDVEKRDYAYTKAAPALEQLLRENPSIQVVIDLHRDEVPEDTKLLTTLNGKPTARFMFFNGLSRTRKTGEIAYLKNPYIDDNLAFAFQMQLACNEYYPGLTRRIYLKGYRYNMHYCPKTLLVELGAQTNTTQEAYNACEPLADMLAKVLLGE